MHKFAFKAKTKKLTFFVFSSSRRIPHHTVLTSTIICLVSIASDIGTIICLANLNSRVGHRHDDISNNRVENHQDDQNRNFACATTRSVDLAKGRAWREDSKTV